MDDKQALALDRAAIGRMKKAFEQLKAENERLKQPWSVLTKTMHEINIKLNAELDKAREEFEVQCEYTTGLETEIIQLKTQLLGGSENDTCVKEGMKPE